MLETSSETTAATSVGSSATARSPVSSRADLEQRVDGDGQPLGLARDEVEEGAAIVLA